MPDMQFPKVILGTMNFGEQVDEKNADKMIRMFLERGYKELDTAHRYSDGLKKRQRDEKETEGRS